MSFSESGKFNEFNRKNIKEGGNLTDDVLFFFSSIYPYTLQDLGLNRGFMIIVMYNPSSVGGMIKMEVLILIIDTFYPQIHSVPQFSEII